MAIDGVSKFALAEMLLRPTCRVVTEFIRRSLEAVPYKIHSVLADNGTQFTNPWQQSFGAHQITAAIAVGEPLPAHAFEYACAMADIDLRLTKPNHPWTNGQVERVSPTIKRRHRPALLLRQP